MTTASLMPSRVIETFVNSRAPRIAFVPAQVDHRIAYQEYQKTGKWMGGCPFKLEWPFLTIPQLCERRLLDFYLSQDTQLHK
jgi:hypothetical protein